MQDSDVKDKPQTEPKNPSGITTLMVANQHGAIREVQKDEKGRFLKKVKPLIPSIEFTRAERKKLNAVRNDKDGLTEYMVAFMNIVRISQNEDSDPKSMMAAVKAFEVIRQSALGKFAPSEQEMDKLQTQPVKVVFVPMPADVKPMEEKPPSNSQPTFAEVTGVVTNPKK